MRYRYRKGCRPGAAVECGECEEAGSEPDTTLEIAELHQWTFEFVNTEGVEVLRAPVRCDQCGYEGDIRVERTPIFD